MAHEKQETDIMHRAISDALGIHWRLFLFQGLVMLALGIFAVALPIAATIAVDIFIGWLFLVCGIVGLFAIFSTRNIPAFTWSLVTAALSTAIGILLIWHPVAGAQSLTVLLTVLFLVEGIFQIATSIAYRDVIRESWGWMLTSGIADLVLVVIIIAWLADDRKLGVGSTRRRQSDHVWLCGHDGGNRWSRHHAFVGGPRYPLAAMILHGL